MARRIVCKVEDGVQDRLVISGGITFADVVVDGMRFVIRME